MAFNFEELDNARDRLEEGDNRSVIWCDDHGFVHPTEEGVCSHCVAHYCGWPDDPDLLAKQ